jgi:DNA-binding beta-propeller fold protein YncE
MKLAMAASAALLLTIVVHAGARGQTPHRSLLILEKDTTQLDIIDPSNLQIVAKVVVGPDPHEVVASPDGKLAYVSNYMGPAQGSQHILSVVDLVAQKALPAIDLGALERPHGLVFAGGKLYFTAESNKVIGRYDPVSRKIDWVMGTGQDRTHMIWVAPTLDRIVTSNVVSGTVSIIEYVPDPRPQRPKLWEVTAVPAGAGSEGFDVSPDQKEIWTGNAQDNTVTIIDFASKKDLQTTPITVKRANRLKFTPDGRYVLVTGLGEGTNGGAGREASASAPNAVVIDAASRKEVKQLNLGGAAEGILMDPDGFRAFVSVSGANKVAVIDLKSLSVVREISPLGQPDGMAWAVRP